MKVMKSYVYGLKEATLRPKMIAVLWVINFLFASVIYFLVSGLWNSTVSWTQAGESLVRKMDYNILLDVLLHHGDQVSLIVSVGVILIFLAILTSLFLKGGVLHCLRHGRVVPGEEFPQKFLPRFFLGAGKYFGRFFRLWIYSLILWVAFVLINLVLTPLGKLLTSDGSNEHLLIYVFMGRVIIGLFLALLIKMIMDYARIKIVVEDSPKVFRSFWQALKYVVHNLGKTLGLFYLFLLTAIVLFLLAWLLKSSVPTLSLLGAVFTFVIGQVVIYLRSWSNVTFQAGQLRLYGETA